jgi:hypothetical protein
MHEVERPLDNVLPHHQELLEFPIVNERPEPGREHRVHERRDAHHDLVLYAERGFRHLWRLGDALDSGTEAVESDELNLVSGVFKRRGDVSGEGKDVEGAHRALGQTRSAAHNSADKRT